MSRVSKTLSNTAILLFSALACNGHVKAEESVGDVSTAATEVLRAELLEKELQIKALTDRLIRLEARIDRIESVKADVTDSGEGNEALAAKDTEIDAGKVVAASGTGAVGQHDQADAAATGTSAHPRS